MLDVTKRPPGVYVEEITPAGPISGAGTSVPALIGVPKKAPAAADLGKPFPVTSWNAYVTQFDDFAAKLLLPMAVRGFFENGGTFAYVVPIKDMGGLDAALDQLTRLPDVSIVCLPGVVDPAQQTKVITHCEQLGDRFAVLDGVQDPTPLKPDGALLTQRGGLLSVNGFGALYWPWLTVPDPLAPPATPGTVAVPPSGHVAGIMARVDGSVGVHRAPANEPVRGAVALDYTLNDAEHAVLNQANINALRTFPGRPPMVWGARTLTADVPWRFVNVRRLVSYIEDSLVTGLRWAVFAPNNTMLWKGIERSVTEFLTRVWQAGALFGTTAGEAFYVVVDEAHNPASVRDQGQVVVEIGLAATRPAEYVIFQIGLWDGGSAVSEG